MASGVESTPELIRSLFADTRDLIREEIALARTEIRDEVTAARTVGAAFGGAAVAGVLGVTVLCIAIGGAIAYALGWPAWAGYGIVAVLLLAAAFLLVRYGRQQLGKLRALPKTTETLKENLSWIQSKSAQR